MSVEDAAWSDDVMARILELKMKAKNRRDDGRYAPAMKFLREALELAREGVDAARPANARSTFATEVADVYGMMGGVERRLALEAIDPADRSAHLRKSIRMYDAGYEYERDGGGMASSYNLVNRLLCRVLEQPQSLNQLEPELVSARAIVASTARRHAQGRPVDARGPRVLDLPVGSEDAATAYGPLHRLSPPTYVYESALDTLRPLAEVASEDRPELRRAVCDLERRTGA